MFHLLFSGRGRIDRSEIVIFLPISAGWALLAASIWLTQFNDLEGAVADLGWEAVLPTLLDPLPHLVATAIILALTAVWYWVAGAMMIKRLHDRNLSGYWLIPTGLAPLALVFLLWAPPASKAVAFGEGALAAFCILSIGWAVREAFFLPGSTGDNRFGPPSHRGRIDRPKGRA